MHRTWEPQMEQACVAHVVSVVLPQTPCQHWFGWSAGKAFSAVDSQKGGFSFCSSLSVLPVLLRRRMPGAGENSLSRWRTQRGWGTVDGFSLWLCLCSLYVSGKCY